MHLLAADPERSERLRVSEREWWWKLRWLWPDVSVLLPWLHATLNNCHRAWPVGLHRRR